MKRLIVGSVLGITAACLLVSFALAQSGHEFKLGFAALAAQIPDVAGEPIEDEHWGPNGDSLQQTTAGLMVWRKADNWTAFTDGGRTWINGPFGVRDRGNEDRFEWEGMAPPAPEAVPVVAVPSVGKVAFVSRRDGNDEIYAMDSDGTGQTRLTSSPAYDGAPAWSTDGRRIAFASKRDGNNEIYVMNADGIGQSNLTRHPGNDLSPAWSPDGERVAFSSSRDDRIDLYVMNADGTGQTRLTAGQGINGSPAWSPDGGRIAFDSTRDGGYEVYVMNADGSNPTHLTGDPAGGALPAWSPDGGRIAFNANRGGNLDVYVMNADGSGQTRLTDHPAPDYHPTWLPDGRIVFASGRDGNDEIYVMNADGSGQTRLTSSPGYDSEPAAAAIGVPRSPVPISVQARPTPAATAAITASLPPTATPMAPSSSPERRPATGTLVHDTARSGLGRLAIENGLDQDALAVLTTTGGASVVSVYVRSRESFTLSGIGDGSYHLYFAVGEEWDGASARFTRNDDYSRFEEPLTFRTTRVSGGTQYSSIRVTLHSVPEGTAPVRSLGRDQFPSTR
ncbi:MAG: hypothetical protein ACYC5J_18435 [Chloroflexota bacterium]